MDRKEQVLKKLDELNIKYELIDHPPVYTIEETESLNLEEKGHIVKNLFEKFQWKKTLSCGAKRR